MTEDEVKELEVLRERVSHLTDVLEDIAMIADGHRKATLRDADGNNVALSAILARAASVIGRAERLRDTGTIFAPPGSVVR